ncbi:MAG: PEPxxWA-CTERM sorting domain-containing protein, partial [Phenylobacterium sp.]
WFVDDGVYWGYNPPVYSGQEAAAFLFGGVASDYAISTISSDVSQINFEAYYDGWADPYTCGYNGPCAQSLHVDVGNDGYEFPYGLDNAFSALVSDHGVHLENFAFSVAGGGAVPEPASWALMIGGFGLAGAALRRRRQVALAA